MVTWDEVTRWDPAPLRDAVSAINNAYNKVVACSDDLRDINTPYGWHGDAASAATAEVNQIIDGLEEYAAEVASLRRSSGDVSDAITGVRNALTEAEGLARTHHFTIGGDGAVTDNGPPPDTPEDQKEAVAAERRTIAAELGDRVEQVLRQAVDIDDDFCAVLDRILAGHTIDATGNDNENTSLAAAGNSGAAMGSLSILAPPPVDASPSANAAWWAALSKNQRVRLIKDHPEMVGNRDGVAAWARSSANIALLDHELQELQEQRTRLTATAPDDLGRDRPLVRDYLEKLQNLDAKLEALTKVNGLVKGPDGKPNPDRQLLSLDLTRDRPKAAIANGDVDKAEHVAVFTPGMNSSVATMDDYVEDMRKVRDTAEDILDSQGDKSQVATVTWLGYEPPTTSDPADIGDIVGGGAAREGADKLVRFDQGINASRPEDPHLTALGHSYGSLATGIALNSHTGVDDAVFFGSPGISDTPAGQGIGESEIRRMQLPEGHAYNLEADGDAVADVGSLSHGRYGTDPSDIAGMNQLATGAAVTPDGRPLAASTGHSEYTKTMPDGTDTTSKYNIAAVVSGHAELAIPARG
ncbi:MAG TPA: alpha/beta hydrolase [Amycolatopsis sp.]|nr:alpha/beta hydrolase [Amycolatopsis sp.]